MMVAGKINLIYQRGRETFEKLYIVKIGFILSFICCFSWQGNIHLSWQGKFHQDQEQTRAF